MAKYRRSACSRSRRANPVHEAHKIVRRSEVLARETSCRAQGHEYCQLEARPMSDWGISAEDIQQRFDINPLEEELTQLNAALRQARENLHRQNAEISRLRGKIFTTDWRFFLCLSAPCASGARTY